MFCMKCGSEIQPDARFCLKCGAHVDGMTTSQPTAPQTTAPQPPLPTKPKWHDNPVIIILSLLFCLPFGLYFLWDGKSMKQSWKVGLTAVVGILVVIFIIVGGVSETTIETPKEDNAITQKDTTEQKSNQSETVKQPEETAEQSEKTPTEVPEAESGVDPTIIEAIGHAPESSPWDAAVKPVVDYLKENLKDPDSVKFAEWSRVFLFKYEGRNYWAVRCKYRAKNSFGGYVVANEVFLIRNNTVERVIPWE